MLFCSNLVVNNFSLEGLNKRWLYQICYILLMPEIPVSFLFLFLKICFHLVKRDLPGLKCLQKNFPCNRGKGICNLLKRDIIITIVLNCSYIFSWLVTRFWLFDQLRRATNTVCYRRNIWKGGRGTWISFIFCEWSSEMGSQ